MDKSKIDKGCVIWLIGLPIYIAISSILAEFWSQICSFIKTNITIIIFIVLIVAIIVLLSIKLYRYIKDNKEIAEIHENNANYYNENYRNIEQEFLNYKKTHSDYKEKFENLKKENKEIKKRNIYLENKIKKTEFERNSAVENLKTAHIEKAIRLYHINVDYKHVSKKETETKAEEYNKHYPPSKNFDGCSGYADIDIIYLKGEKTSKIILLHDLFFHNNRVSCEHFDNNISKKDLPVKNLLIADSFSYVVSNKGERYIVRLSDYSITKNFDKYYNVKISINKKNKK